MKKIILFTALSTALFSMSAAHAGGGSSIFSDTSGGGATMAGLYGGASAGRIFDDNCITASHASEEKGHQSFDSCAESSNDTAWKVFGGYKFMPNFAVEGAYINFADAEAGDDNYLHAKGSLKGVSLMGVASTSVTDNINVFGKFGVLRWKGEVSLTDNKNYENLTIAGTGTDLAIGAGAEVKVTDNIAVRGEIEHFDEINTNLLTLGASFSTL